MDARLVRKWNVVVCGTTFGQVYLEALRKPEIPFHLVGILSQGSERSRACAAFYGVPLFTRVEDLPNGVDVACVVVRGSLLGGRGTELVMKLLERGIHVLQEHPVHHDELAECLRRAHRYGVHYQLNSFYPYLQTVRAYISAAQRLLVSHKALYIDTACSFQVGYALLDVLRLVIGRIQPLKLAAVGSRSPSGSQVRQQLFRSVEGEFGGVFLSLRVQHQLHASDPDDKALLLHRITLGTDAGELSLASTHGPIIWTARPKIPRQVRDADSTSLFADEVTTNDESSAAVLGCAEGASQSRLFHSMWPGAVTQALLKFRESIEGRDNSLQRGQPHLTLCRVWQEIADQLGPPALIKSDDRWTALSHSDLSEIRRSANGAEPMLNARGS